MARPKKTVAEVPAEEQLSASEKITQSRSIKAKAKFPKLRDKYLTDSGVVGWETISRPMMASLLAGHVLTLMGSHGTAKTYACKRIAAKWLGKAETTLVIDASKVDWEEILGPYNLADMREGRFSYVTTPLSIWNKNVLIVDELTRSGKKVQNGLLEVLRNNTLQHLPTQIEYKWCAANSLSYPGCEPLDDALADRVMYVLNPPDLLDLKESDLKGVLGQAESVDEQVIAKFVPGFEKKAESYPDLQKEINEYLLGCGKQFKIIKENLKVKEYVTALTTLYMKSLDPKDIAGQNMYTFSSRRAGMIHNAIIANLAVELYEYETYINNSTKDLSDDKKKKWMDKNAFTTEEKTDWMREIIYDTVMTTINVQLTGKKFPKEGLAAAHRIALLNIDSNDLSPLYRIKTEKNLVKQFIKSLILQDANDGEGIVEVHDCYRRLEESIPTPTEEGKDRDGYIALLFLLTRGSAYKKLLDRVPEEILEKMKQKTQYAFKYVILNKTEDLSPAIQDYVGQNIYEDMQKEYTDEEWWQQHVLDLDPVERTQRSVAFNELKANERYYLNCTFALGKIEENPGDAKIEAEQKAIITKELANIDNIFINEIVPRVDKVHDLIKEAIAEEGFDIN